MNVAIFPWIELSQLITVFFSCTFQRYPFRYNRFCKLNVYTQMTRINSIQSQPVNFCTRSQVQWRGAVEPFVKRALSACEAANSDRWCVQRRVRCIRTSSTRYNGRVNLESTTVANLWPKWYRRAGRWVALLSSTRCCCWIDSNACAYICSYSHKIAYEWTVRSVE